MVDTLLRRAQARFGMAFRIPPGLGRGHPLFDGPDQEIDRAASLVELLLVAPSDLRRQEVLAGLAQDPLLDRPPPAVSFQLDSGGIVAASSIISRSRNGTRPSIEWAIVMRSTRWRLMLCRDLTERRSSRRRRAGSS